MHRFCPASPRLCAAGVAALILISASQASAIDADAAVALAKRGNKDLTAARSLIREMEARAAQSGKLANPELETEIAGGQDFEGRVSLGISQRFPLTSRLRFERELSALDFESARLEVRAREWQLGIATRIAFYELAAARAALALARSQTEVAIAFSKSLKESIAEGFGSKLESQQSSLSADILRTKQETLQIDEIQAAARLSGLLGLPTTAPITINEALDLPKQVPGARPVGNRADLALAELVMRSGATGILLAQATRWDDIGVGVFVEGGRSRDEPVGVQSEAFVGVRLNIPLPVWQNNAGKIAEKEAAHARSAQHLEALRFSAQNGVNTAHRVMTARHSTASQLQNQVVPAARRQVADTEAAYGRAEVDIQSLFLARERLAEIEFAALDARKNYFLSQSEWLGAIGEPMSQP